MQSPGKPGESIATSFEDVPMQSEPVPNPASATSIQVFDRPGRILVADASPNVCALLADRLARQQHVVFTALNVAEALKVAHEEAPELVLLDASLPDAAKDLCQTIKKLPHCEHTFVILTTACQDVEAHALCLACSANDFLIKPIAESILAVRVHFALKYYRSVMRVQTVNADLKAEVKSRRQAEKAFRDQKEYIEHILSTAPALIVRIAPDGTALSVNQAAVSILGYSIAEIIGKNWWQMFYPGEERAQVDRLFREFKAGNVTNYTMTMTARNGDKRVIGWNSANRRASDGRLLDVIKIGVDMTEQAHLENQLRWSQKMEAVGRLAGGVAHDFNNLLMIISGYTDLLLEKLPAKNKLREDAELIHAAAERATHLTRRLLAFSRKQILHPKVLNLNKVVAGVGKLLRRLIGENIQVVIALTKQPLHVRVDPDQLEQVFLNLCVNSRDAMPNGGRLVIEIGTADEDTICRRQHVRVNPGRFGRISISDTGCGMNAETEAHLFEPFFSSKDPGKGTGLGLSSVYGIVKQSGGYIYVQSNSGHGTTFSIYLPRVDAVRGPVAAASSGTMRTVGKETILLVEDEAVVRHLVRHMLLQSGYRVLDAKNGREALRIAKKRSRSPHLLITDIVMPGMNGRELANRLQSIWPEMKVLYMSGYADQAVASAGELEGGLAFLEKPFKTSTLVCKVQEVLDQSSVSTASGTVDKCRAPVLKCL
jgi:PAS domain S-box-containing protein